MTMSKFKLRNKEQGFLLPPSVEDFIPKDHLARLIDQLVEQFDTTAIEAKYSSLGQKSYHPKLLLKLLIYGYSIGIRSGRKIAGLCRSDTAFMFLACMYHPDFRTINDFRKDNVNEVSNYFLHVLQLCKQLGLTQVGTLYIDSTKIKANASPARTKSKVAYEQWLTQIKSQISEVLNEAEQTDAAEDKEYGDKRGDELPEELQDKQRLAQKIEELIKNLPAADDKINLTDPEAKNMKNAGKIIPGYNCQATVNDGGIILCAYATTNASDKTELKNTIEQTQINIGEQITAIAADGGYSSYDNYQMLDEKNITAYLPDQQYAIQDQLNKAPYDKSHFIYHQQEDYYSCPQGNKLTYRGIYNNRRYKQKSRLYEGISCATCKVKQQCTKGSVRQLHQELRETLRQRARDLLQTAKGKIKYSKRMSTIEPIFGNLKQNLNFRAFQLRGKIKADAEFKLQCLCHNIKKIFQAYKIQFA